jgi:hypothetical protein
MVRDRVTVTLPVDVVRDIDRRERNRSKFVLEAVQRELKRRRRAELHRSLRNPHPETRDFADLGLRGWASHLPAEDCEVLVNTKAGKAVRWQPGRGWVVSASEDHTLKVWDLETCAPLATFTCDSVARCCTLAGAGLDHCGGPRWPGSLSLPRTW